MQVHCSKSKLFRWIAAMWVKSDFRTEISKNDPKLKKLYLLNGELAKLTTQQSIFEMSQKEKSDWNKKIELLTKDIQNLETDIEEIKTNKIYENAFEWRFEFPEVLNDNGDFIGFDIVIGNPPYFSMSTIENNIQNYFISSDYNTFTKNTDIYCLFIELAKKIGNNYGLNHFIISNKWLTASYGLKTRTFLTEHTSNIFIIDFNKYQVFDEVTVDSCLLDFSNKNGKTTDYLKFDIKDKSETIVDFLNNISPSTKTINLNDNWNIGGFEYQSIKEKIATKGKQLLKWEVNFYRGITTGFNEAFVIDEETKNKLLAKDKKNLSIIKPLLRGRDIKRYKFEKGLLRLINTHNGLKFENIRPIEVSKFFPTIYNHLITHKDKLINRIDKGKDWSNLRSCAYLKEFEKEKLVFTKASKVQAFAYDTEGYFVLNTSYILTGEKLKYLLALLNSKLVKFAFKNFYQSGGIEGEITVQAIEQIPIIYPTEKQESKLKKLAEQILELKSKDKDTNDLETQIDQLVYQLYDLTKEEIEIVENSVNISW